MITHARGFFKYVRVTEHGHELIQSLEDAYLDHLAADEADQDDSYSALCAARLALYRYLATIETEAGRLLAGKYQDTARVRFT